MEAHREHDDILLTQQSSSLSNGSFGSNSTIIASPQTPSSFKTGHEYGDVSSVSEEEDSYHIDSTLHSSGKSGQGLGITYLSSRKGSSMKGSQGVPGSADPFLSPVSATLSDIDGPHSKIPEGSPYDNTSADAYEGFAVDSDHGRLQMNASSGLVDNMDLVCQSRRSLISGRGSWTVLSILALSIYSTVFSGIWLCIGILRPQISSEGTLGLGIKNVGVLCTTVARSIEISFATVFVALIGQVLSTRAIGSKKSITLAEILMRSWVMQPGNMLSHWESVMYAINTWLGQVALLVAVLVMLYTTASNALVTPNLNIVHRDGLILHGMATTSFANVSNINTHCITPITKTLDPDNAGSTCSEIQHSGQAYHNFMQYLSFWVETTGVTPNSVDMKSRPVPFAVSPRTSSS
jgi:hypothetical protein